MPKPDDEHFDDYSSQTQAKHEILSGYLPSYFLALSKQVDFFHYIDGFAGRGMYKGNNPGSPLLALQALQKAKVLSRSTISITENLDSFFTELKSAVLASPEAAELVEPPLIKQGRFSAHVDEVLIRSIYRRGGRVATFAFIDPCGVDGVKMRDLARLLKQPFGEVLLFFNYSAVERLLGGFKAGTHEVRIIADLFGNEERILKLVSQIGVSGSGEEKERVIRSHFIEAMRAETSTKYLLPFRFEARTADRTSHFLLHCSNHCLAFRMMKHVMTSAGRSDPEQYGSLQFEQEKDRVQFKLFRGDIHAQKTKIIRRLAQGPCKASEFKSVWVCEIDDPFAEADYTRMLLELESDGLISVFDKDNRQLAPRASRRKNFGQPTLGPDYWLRIKA